MELDFPKRTKLPDSLAQQNYGLLKVFGVRGYPTIWYFDIAGVQEGNKYNIKPYGQQGYPRGYQPGKQEVVFLAEANKILKKREAE